MLVQASRASTIGSADPSNVTYPHGTVTVDPYRREICGSNPERQDFIIQPVSTPATNWSGYFCARFDQPFASWGVAQNGTLTKDAIKGDGALLSAWATFEATTVDVRVGVSFISVEQARKK